jgi:ketol-acid reductoisomerase
VTAAQFEELETPVVEAVLRWRFEALVEAGYDAGSALILASHVEVDLHQAADLLARGCPPDTAMSICL